jgi:hypothetical protein
MNPEGNRITRTPPSQISPSVRPSLNQADDPHDRQVAGCAPTSSNPSLAIGHGGTR